MSLANNLQSNQERPRSTAAKHGKIPSISRGPTSKWSVYQLAARRIFAQLVFVGLSYGTEYARDGDLESRIQYSLSMGTRLHPPESLFFLTTITIFAADYRSKTPSEWG